MLGLIVSLILVGIIAGALARMMIPGKHDISTPETIATGLVGSFVGGFSGYLIFHRNQAAGFCRPPGTVGSVIGAAIFLFWYLRTALAAASANHRPGD